MGGFYWFVAGRCGCIFLHFFRLIIFVIPRWLNERRTLGLLSFHAYGHLLFGIGAIFLLFAGYNFIINGCCQL